MFIQLFAVIAVWSWVGLTLAELGWFRLPLLVALSVAGSALALASVPRPSFGHWREASWAIVWIALATALFAGPGEYALDGADGTVYLNIGAALERHGTLTFQEPLLGLTDPVDRPSIMKPVRGVIPVLDLFPGGIQVSHEGNVVRPNFFHLYPVWIGIADALGGVKAGYHVSWMFGVLGVLAIWMLGRELDSLTAANVAAGLLTVNFAQVWFARAASSELVAQFFVLSGLALLAAAVRARSRASGAAAGTAFGLAACTRIDVLLLVLPIVGAGCALVWLRRRWSPVWTAAFIPCALLTTQAVAHALLISGPYTLRVLRLMFAGRAVSYAALALPIVIVGLGMWLWLVSAGRVRRPPRWAVLSTAAALAILGIVRLGPELVSGYLAMLITPIGCALAVAGAIWLLRERSSEEMVLVVGILLMSALVYAESLRDRPELPQLFRRFVPVVLPLSLVLAGIAVARISVTVGRFRPVVLLLPIVLGGMQLRNIQPVLADAPMRGIHDQLTAVASRLPADAVLVTDATTPSHFGMSLRYLFDRRVLFAHPREGAADVIRNWAAQIEGQDQQLFVAVARDGRATDAPVLDAANLAGLDLSPAGTFELALRQLRPTTETLPHEIHEVRPTIELYAAKRRSTVALPLRIDIGDHDAAWRESGFHGYERMGDSAARWTTGEAVVRLPQLAPDALPTRLVLRVAAWRPAGIPSPRASIMIGDEPVGATPPLDGSFQVIEISIPAPLMEKLRASASRLILRVPVFTPSAAGDSTDDRALGLAIDWLHLERE